MKIKILISVKNLVDKLKDVYLKRDKKNKKLLGRAEELKQKITDFENMKNLLT